MVLNAGKRLELYEILEPMGAGGMGEVYRARDTKLGREVAIKVLPEEFSQDKERLSRFEREAKLLASLNHSSIATLHGLEETEGVHYLVMELVEGETLAERISKSPMPLGEVLPLFEQMAEGLEAAHSKHIIHRDLKPANVKITPEGKVKILDFGLAKLIREEAQGGDLSEFSTLAADTSAVVLLGTVPYMSPEQVRTQSVDHRTDIWAFGCVLYEALTGKVAFGGPTVSDTVGAILNQEPEWSSLSENLPFKVRELVERCLRKDPHHRLQHMGDARLSLLETREGWKSSTAVAPKRGKHRFTLLATALAVVLLGTLAIREFSRPREDSAGPVVRSELLLPRSAQAGAIGIAPLALSPDGRWLAFSARSDDPSLPELYAMEMEQGEAVPIPGGEGGMSPFFSPDGRRLGFLAEGHLKKVTLPDGVPVDVCAVPHEFPILFGASWFGDEIFFASHAPDSGLWRVSASGEEPQVVTEAGENQGEVFYSWPDMLPGGKTLLFTIGRGEERFDTALYHLDTGEKRLLVEDASHARYLPTGHLLFLRDNRLLAAPFDPHALVFTGEPKAVFESVASFAGGSVSSFSQNGIFVYAKPPSREFSLVWVSRAGEEEMLADLKRDIRDPKISPDGRNVAFIIHEQPPDHYADLWLYNLSRETLTRLTVGEHVYAPIWNPDGRSISVTHSRQPEGGSRIIQVPTVDRGEPEILVEFDMPGAAAAAAWTPDGQTLFLEQIVESHSDILLFSKRDPAPRPLLQEAFEEYHPKLSPDEHWLAYVSNESGRSEIYLRAYPELDRKIQVSNRGGDEPTWNPNGRELFYLNGTQMISVEIETTPKLRVEKPQLLFEAEEDYDEHYDVTPAGNRFLMVRRQSGEDPERVHVVINWFEELKRLVPTN